MTKSKSTLQKSKKIYFRLFAVFLIVLFFGLIEIALRLFSYGNNLSLFITHPEENFENYYTTNPRIGEKYFIKFDATGGVNDVFLKKKPENTYRIFVLGSSTVVGFPYDKNLMFSRILHQRLMDAYPKKNIEMVNTAITAVNSITLLDFMHEIIKYEPDAIVIYAGHNEFYGAFGIGSNETLSRNNLIQSIHFKMMHLRIYQLMRNSTNSIVESLKGDNSELNKKGSLMKRIVANKNIEYGGEAYGIGISQYRNNLTEILQLAKVNRVDVFISDVISDVKDTPPFGSASFDKYPAAQDIYKEAWNQYHESNFAKADSLFNLAKDMDLVRFRASEQINHIIDSLSEAYKCHKVSTLKSFKEASPNGIIGHNLVTEHLHPNISGQFLLADAFFTTIRNSQKVELNSLSDEIKPASYYRSNWPYTELDSLIGLYKVNQLKSYWPFKTIDDAVTFRDKHKPIGTLDSLAFQSIMTTSPNIARLHDQLASEYAKKGNYEKALRENLAMIKISPYWSNYYNKAAICYLTLDDLYKAENLLKVALKYNPDNLTYITLADIELIKLNLKQAVSYYTLALEKAKLKVDRIATLKKLSFSCSLLGHIPEKLKYEKMLKKLGENYVSEETSMPFTYSRYIPNDIKLHLQKSVEYFEKQQYDSALFWNEKAILINDCPVANFYMGEKLKVLKNKKLLSFYQKAYPAYRFDVNFLHSFFISHLVNSNFGEAKQVLMEIKEIDPNYALIPKLEKAIQGK